MLDDQLPPLRTEDNYFPSGTLLLSGIEPQEKSRSADPEHIGRIIPRVLLGIKTGRLTK